jgi:hypothetical protein
MRGWRSTIGPYAVAVALSSVSDRSADARQNPSNMSNQPLTVAVCTGTVEATVREYSLQRTSGPGGPSWQLVMQGGPVGKHPVLLPLPRATPELAADRVSLTYKTANGGRQVTLAATPAQSTLDVYVDFGLEVNVDANLDPRVDDMNTHGGAAMRCTIDSEAARAAP